MLKPADLCWAHVVNVLDYSLSFRIQMNILGCLTYNLAIHISKELKLNYICKKISVS